jgi:superfamily II helicase
MLLPRTFDMIFVQSKEAQPNNDQVLESMRVVDFRKVMQIIRDNYHCDNLHKLLEKIVKKILTFKYKTNEKEELYLLLVNIVSLLDKHPNVLISLVKILMDFLEKMGTDDILSSYLENCILQILNIVSEFYNNNRITAKLRRNFGIFTLGQNILTRLKNLGAKKFFALLLRILRFIMNKEIYIKVRIYFFDIFQEFFDQLAFGSILNNYLQNLREQLMTDLEEENRKLDNSF